MYFSFLIIYCSARVVEISFFLGYLVKELPYSVTEHAKEKKDQRCLSQKWVTEELEKKKYSAHCNWIITYIKS